MVSYRLDDYFFRDTDRKLSLIAFRKSGEELAFELRMGVAIVGFGRMEAGESIVVRKICRMGSNSDGMDGYAW